MAAIAEACSPAGYVAATIPGNRVQYTIPVGERKGDRMEFYHALPADVQKEEAHPRDISFAAWYSPLEQTKEGGYRPAKGTERLFLVTFVGRETEGGPILHLGSCVCEFKEGEYEKDGRTTRVMFNRGHREQRDGTPGVLLSEYRNARIVGDAFTSLKRFQALTGGPSLREELHGVSDGPPKGTMMNGKPTKYTAFQFSRPRQLLFPNSIVEGSWGIPLMSIPRARDTVHLALCALERMRCHAASYASGKRKHAPMKLEQYICGLVGEMSRYVSERSDDTVSNIASLSEGDDCDGMAIRAASILKSISECEWSRAKIAALAAEVLRPYPRLIKEVMERLRELPGKVVALGTGCALLGEKRNSTGHCWVVILNAPLPSGYQKLDLSCECTGVGDRHWQFLGCIFGEASAHTFVKKKARGVTAGCHPYDPDGYVFPALTIENNVPHRPVTPVHMFVEDNLDVSCFFEKRLHGRPGTFGAWLRFKEERQSVESSDRAHGKLM